MHVRIKWPVRVFVTSLWNTWSSIFKWPAFPRLLRLPFCILWVRCVAVAFQHSSEGFCLDTETSKTHISVWLGVFIPWADEKAGGYNEARQDLDCDSPDSLWNASEQYQKPGKNRRDGINSCFNTKDCWGFFFFCSKGQMWPSVTHKQIRSTFFILSIPSLHWWKYMPQAQEKPPILGPTDTLISPTSQKERETLELHLCSRSIFRKQAESSWRV